MLMEQENGYAPYVEIRYKKQPRLIANGVGAPGTAERSEADKTTSSIILLYTYI
jgi:hypothetical protein